MNKSDLISAMADNSGLTKKDSEKALNAFIESIGDALKSGEKIQLIGFGTFEPRERAERKGRNPKTNEDLIIPAATVPAFKPGKELKEKVNNK